METFQLFANPWWVNFLIFVPVAAYFIFRKKKLDLGRKQMATSFIFGAAFGFVEAAVVVYLRAALGMALPSAQMVANFPVTLIVTEVFREAATITMLLTVSLLAAKGTRERWALFLWMFAAWDIFYYLFLWIIIRWPFSLMTPDVLFLIPTPWYAEVWFPILVDALTLVVIGAKALV